MTSSPSWTARTRLLLALAAAITVAAVLVGAGVLRPTSTVSAAHAPTAPASPSASPMVSPSTETPIPVPPAPRNLPLVDYFKAVPAGFPRDLDASSPVPLTQALRPTKTIAAYDAPGGRALLRLAPMISGVPLIMPIVDRRQGWRGVLLPSANRTVGWVPPGGWTTVALRDQLVVQLKAHRLSWYRSGVLKRSWTVAVGAARTPTPIGRTFVLARTSGHSSVYAGVDILALGAVPEYPDRVASGLSRAHTGIHAWYDSSVFGRNVSNGCVRIPPSAQRQLVAEIDPGTEVLILP